MNGDEGTNEESMTEDRHHQPKKVDRNEE